MAPSRHLAFLLPDMRGGGAERVALRLMEDFVGAGHRVDLVLMSAEGELMNLLPPEVRVFDLKAPRIRHVLLPLRRYLRQERPDAIQISMWPLTSVALVAHRLAASKARTVVSEHITLSKQYSHFGPLRYAGLRTSIRLTYPRADVRITVAQRAAEDLSRLAGIPRDSIDVVYNPVAKPPADPKTEPAIEAMWGQVRDRIITVGRLKPQKNHALLIRSFAKLLRSRDAKLMIVGEGELRDQLEALAQAEGVSDRVLLPGFYTDPWPLYASAHLFVLSSDFEGYPLVLIEAMRAGLPIVSTDCESGPEEILDGGRFGTLVQCRDVDGLAEAMDHGLESPNDPELMKARAAALSGQDTSDRYFELMTGEWVR